MDKVCYCAHYSFFPLFSSSSYWTLYLTLSLTLPFSYPPSYFSLCLPLFRSSAWVGSTHITSESCISKYPSWRSALCVGVGVCARVCLSSACLGLWLGAPYAHVLPSFLPPFFLPLFLTFSPSYFPFITLPSPSLPSPCRKWTTLTSLNSGKYSSDQGQCTLSWSCAKGGSCLMKSHTMLKGD